MKYLLVFAIIFSFALILFHRLPQTYFQQDEWHNFGYIILNDFNILNDFKNNWVSYLTGNMRFLAIMLSYFTFSTFGFHAQYYAYFSIFFHALNAFLVYYLVLTLLNSKKVAFVAASLFLINSAHMQAYMWFGTITGTLPNAALALLSLIFFIKYLQVGKRMFYISSMVLLVLSISFKESSIFLLFFYIVLAYFWYDKKKQSFKKFLSSYRLLAVITCILSFIYATPILRAFFGNSSVTVGGAGGSGDTFLSFGYNFITYSLEALTQTFIVSYYIFDWANAITHAKFNSLYGSEIMRLSVVAEYVTVMISFAILIVILIIYHYILKNRRIERKMLIFFTLYIFLSVLPFVILQKSIAVLESRQYYLPTIGASVLFGIFMQGVLVKYSQKPSSQKSTLLLLVFFGLIAWYLSGHIAFIQKEIKTKEEIGAPRKMIVEKIAQTYPAIPKKSVFFTQSDGYYYGSEFSVMPFQSGFGQIVIVLYSLNKSIDPRLNGGDFLWGIFDEGYREVEESGFGYYRTYDKLVDVVWEQNISNNAIFAFRWQKENLFDITDEIRKKVAFDLRNRNNTSKER